MSNKYALHVIVRGDLSRIRYDMLEHLYQGVFGTRFDVSRSQYALPMETCRVTDKDVLERIRGCLATPTTRDTFDDPMFDVIVRTSASDFGFGDVAYRSIVQVPLKSLPDLSDRAEIIRAAAEVMHSLVLVPESVKIVAVSYEPHFEDVV